MKIADLSRKTSPPPKGKFFAPDPESKLLMWDMVRAMDIDLAAALRTNTLPVATLSAMMQACNSCPEPKLCAVFLDRRDGHTDQAPSFCPNGARLAALRGSTAKTEISTE